MCLAVGNLTAAEYQLDESLAPESAQDATTALEIITSEGERPPRRSIFALDFSEAAPFWRDSESELNFKVYEFDRNDGVTSLGEAFAAGSELTFRSGKWRDRMSVTTTWHTSHGIDAPKNLGNTGLLAPDQSDLSTISRAYLDYSLNQETSIRAYRQDFNLPYLNREDSRMIPNTHEGYVVRNAGQRLQYIGGHITKMKKRDSEQFVHMGTIAGVDDNKEGTSIAGVQYAFLNGLSLGGLTLHTDDILTTTYLESSYERSLSDSWGLQLAAQYTDQQSNGKELIGDFDTSSWGVQSRLSYFSTVVTAAYSRTGSDSAMRKPFGGTPGFTSSMLFDFDRANEQAWRLGFSQNFARLGAPGLSLVANYTKGSDARSDSGVILADEDEIALTFDIRPQSGLFEGLWLRLRFSEGDRGRDEDDRRDFRLILSFSLGAFQ